MLFCAIYARRGVVTAGHPRRIVSLWLARRAVASGWDLLHLTGALGAIGAWVLARVRVARRRVAELRPARRDERSLRWLGERT